MDVYQPRTMPSYGYDSTYPSFQSAGMPVFGYDASADRFTALNPQSSAGNAARFRQFNGQERDIESRLDYFHARYYSPEQGRFMSPDPENAGSDPKNPLTWNGYAYAGNNPLSITDPSGQSWFSWLVGAGVFASAFFDGGASFAALGPALEAGLTAESYFNAFEQTRQWKLFGVRCGYRRGFRVSGTATKMNNC